MAPVIEVVTERAILGEGPHWDVPNQCLYYVDIFGQTINKYVPATKTHTKVKLGEFKFNTNFSNENKFSSNENKYISNENEFSFIISEGGPVTLVVPVDGTEDQFLASIGRKLVLVTWNGTSTKPTKTEELLEVENEEDLKGNRFNDGKADPTGRLWAGTMGPEPEIGKLEPEKGSLYTLIGKRQVKKHLSKVSIANGLAWNVKLKKMYYIDSPRRTVDQYDYDMEKGEISNRKVVFDLEKHDIPGVPDGMTIDSQGNLWVAVFDGGRILHVNPNTSELISTLNFPAKQVLISITH